VDGRDNDGSADDDTILIGTAEYGREDDGAVVNNAAADDGAVVDGKVKDG
jgi:hypothetical protein